MALAINQFDLWLDGMALVSDGTKTLNDLRQDLALTGWIEKLDAIQQPI